MKDINDQNISFFSPHPYFIAGFFGPQQILQLVWLYRLWKLDSKKPLDRGELDRIGECSFLLMIQLKTEMLTRYCSDICS